MTVFLHALATLFTWGKTRVVNGKKIYPTFVFSEKLGNSKRRVGVLDFFSGGLGIQSVWSKLTRCSLIFRDLSPLWIALYWKCTTVPWVKFEKGISQWNWGGSKVPAGSVKNSAEDDSHCASPSPSTTHSQDYRTQRPPDRPDSLPFPLPH